MKIHFRTVFGVALAMLALPFVLSAQQNDQRRKTTRDTFYFEQVAGRVIQHHDIDYEDGGTIREKLPIGGVDTFKRVALNKVIDSWRLFHQSATTVMTFNDFRQSSNQLSQHHNSIAGDPIWREINKLFYKQLVDTATVAKAWKYHNGATVDITMTLNQNNSIRVRGLPNTQQNDQVFARMWSNNVVQLENYPIGSNIGTWLFRVEILKDNGRTRIEWRTWDNAIILKPT